MQDQSDLVGNLLVVLVIYEMSINDSPSFNSFCKSFSHKPVTLFIYDNSKAPQVAPSMSNGAVTYQHDPSNPGVSKAYNEGFKVAKLLNKKWLLLADQDTEFPTTIFSDYADALKVHPQIFFFTPTLMDAKGILSPFKLRWGKGKRIEALKPSAYSFKKFKVMNSGLLVSADAFEKAGGYDERFPLDYSDISFLDRVCKDDPKFILIQSRCHHHFSGTKKDALLVELDRFSAH
jgi:rhamnosyltransferase